MRTLKEIDQDYVNVCAKIGHLEVQLNDLPKEIAKAHELATLLKEEASVARAQDAKDQNPKAKKEPKA